VKRPVAPFALGVVGAASALLLAMCSSPGDACRSDSDCGGDLICAKPEVDGGPAESGACTHHPAGPGAFCRVGDDCARGLFCSNELPSPTKRLDGNCIPLRALGETCANPEQCSPPLDCASTAPDDGTCQPVPDADAGADADAATDPDAGADA
jgi:hypothetical protein